MTEDQRFNKINFNNNLKEGQSGIGDYSDFNNNSILVQNATSTNGFTIVGGAQTAQNNTTNNSRKGVKYSNDNVKKMNQRSQSVLKSHTEFNHNFLNNNQGTTGSIGSSTTQRANITTLNQVPGSRSTVKGVVKSIGMKTFSNSGN